MMLVCVVCGVSGPMNAVIIAQAQAAMATVNFIKTIGFDDNNQSVNVQFSYSAINATTGQLTENTLSVPLLSIVPIPYIRVSVCVSVDVCWAHDPCV